MFSSLRDFFDFSDLSHQAEEARVLAQQAPEAVQTLGLSEIGSNLSILVSFLGKIVVFFTTALGWIGGWGILLLVFTFFILSLLNFLSPFKKSNYFLAIIFLSIYAYVSSIPLESLLKFWLIMASPALLSLMLYSLSWAIQKILPQKRKKADKMSADYLCARRHIPLALLRRERRAFSRL